MWFHMSRLLLWHFYDSAGHTKYVMNNYGDGYELFWPPLREFMVDTKDICYEIGVVIFIGTLRIFVVTFWNCLVVSMEPFSQILSKFMRNWI